MEGTIRELVNSLKTSGYERSDIKAFTMKEKSTIKEILTKDWVLKQAEEDQSVESVLLGYVGALDHIVQCLHYDMVWKTNMNDDNNDPDMGDDDDDSDKK